MTCAGVRRRLSEWLDGELDGRARRATCPAHLAVCAACARHADELRAVSGLLAELPRVERGAGRGAASRCSSSSRAERAVPRLALLFRGFAAARPLILPSLVPAACVLLLVLGALLALDPGPLPEVRLAPGAWSAAPASGTEGNPLFPSAEVLLPQQLAALVARAGGARGQGEGSVFLETVVARDGSVAGVTLLEGDAGVEQALIDALRQQRFEPVRYRGPPRRGERLPPDQPDGGPLAADLRRRRGRQHRLEPSAASEPPGARRVATAGPRAPRARDRSGRRARASARRRRRRGARRRRRCRGRGRRARAPRPARRSGHSRARTASRGASSRASAGPATSSHGRPPASARAASTKRARGQFFAGDPLPGWTARKRRAGPRVRSAASRRSSSVKPRTGTSTRLGAGASRQRGATACASQTSRVRSARGRRRVVDDQAPRRAAASLEERARCGCSRRRRRPRRARARPAPVRPSPGEQGRDLGAVPRQDRRRRAPGPSRTLARARGRQQAHAVARRAQRRDRRPQQEQVAERSGADEQDVQGERSYGHVDAGRGDVAEQVARAQHRHAPAAPVRAGSSTRKLSSSPSAMPSSGWTSSQGPASIESSSRRTGSSRRARPRGSRRAAADRASR